MDRMILLGLGVIGLGSLAFLFGLLLWVMIGSGFAPWWIAIPFVFMFLGGGRLIYALLYPRNK